MKNKKNYWFTFLMLSLTFSSLAVSLSAPLFAISGFLFAIVALRGAMKVKKK